MTNTFFPLRTLDHGCFAWYGSKSSNCIVFTLFISISLRSSIRHEPNMSTCYESSIINSPNLSKFSSVSGKKPERCCMLYMPI